METYDGDIPTYLKQMNKSNQSIKKNQETLDYDGTKPKKDTLHIYH